MAVRMLEATRPWTLKELHRLPDDGNKYELVRGELFVTPPPSTGHEDVLARLSRILDPYVAEQGLGYAYHPRSVMQFEGSEVEPDLMVRAPHREAVHRRLAAEWPDLLRPLGAGNGFRPPPVDR